MSSKKYMGVQKGDIFYADLGETIGSEQSGVLTVVVIQNDIGNQYSPTVIVAPITSKVKKQMLPTHVEIGERFGLTEYSVVLLEQLRTIDWKRISGYVGKVDSKTLRQINKALRASLDLE
jgi:mRNA interferase MazF